MSHTPPGPRVPVGGRLKHARIELRPAPGVSLAELRAEISADPAKWRVVEDTAQNCIRLETRNHG